MKKFKIKNQRGLARYLKNRGKIDIFFMLNYGKLITKETHIAIIIGSGYNKKEELGQVHFD